ncbi:LOW QUALITY PROTEIN: nephrocan-like [Liasis olivaceus]
MASTLSLPSSPQDSGSPDPADVLAGIPSCPKCSCDLARSMQCYQVGEVPKEIPSTTVSGIHISYSKIKHLQIADIHKMPALEEFVLVCSGTESVEINTFKDLDALKILEHWKNKLTHIPTSLPENLEILKLADNLISVLHESDFEGLKKLRELDIQSNLILVFPFSTFSSLISLQSLTLDGNNMESVPGSLHLPNLKYLSMKNNKLQSFSRSLFTSLHNLLFLNLNGNLLTDVPSDLLKTLLPLKLERNQLKVLKSGDMKQLTNLSKLCLSENQLSSVDGVQLLSDLTRLELPKNQLQTIPLSLPVTLQKIDFTNNLIESIKAQEFQDLQNLNHLFLDNNVVTTFEDGGLQKCILLSNLAFEQNQFNTIPLKSRTNTFKTSKGVKLWNNKISILDYNLFKHLPHLRYLHLDGNAWNCTCELLQTRSILIKGTEVKAGQCTSPAESQGESWMSSRTIFYLFYFMYLLYLYNCPHKSDKSDLT